MPDYPFTYLYEEDDKKVYVSCGSADLNVVLNHHIDFLKAVGYDYKDKINLGTWDVPIKAPFNIF
jgi:hypothetical protein